jgi:hypothetical protein
MAIDSLCVGCGKTLRVGVEYAGRKARCPMCGAIYVVPQIPSDAHIALPLAAPINAIEGSPINSDPTHTETTYAASVSPSSQSNDPSDKWESFPTEKPAARLIETASAEPPAVSAMSASSVSSPSPIVQTPVQYFARTPNGMIYGPSDRKTVMDWIDQGRLDDTCHVRESNSEQWLGIAAWRFQSRQTSNPMSYQATGASPTFGAVPSSTIQSAGFERSGNGVLILVLGIVSWLLCPTIIGAAVCSILAIVFATTELRRIREGQTTSKEKSLVLIGMWLGILNAVALVIGIIGMVLVIALAD